MSDRNGGAMEYRDSGATMPATCSPSGSLTTTMTSQCDPRPSQVSMVSRWTSKVDYNACPIVVAADAAGGGGHVGSMTIVVEVLCKRHADMQ